MIEGDILIIWITIILIVIILLSAPVARCTYQKMNPKKKYLGPPSLGGTTFPKKNLIIPTFIEVATCRHCPDDPQSAGCYERQANSHCPVWSEI